MVSRRKEGRACKIHRLSPVGEQPSTATPHGCRSSTFLLTLLHATQSAASTGAAGFLLSNRRIRTHKPPGSRLSSKPHWSLSLLGKPAIGTRGSHLDF